jgi:vanillate O-demethylase monooxygenase subunit
MKLMGRDVDRYTDANFVLPGAHLAYARIVNTQAEPDEIETHRVNLLHAITPERQDSLHYWWFLSRDFAQDDQTATDYLIASVNKAFNEDVEALTAIADQHRDGVDFQEMSFATDRPGLAMRKIVAGLADREAAAKDPQAS